MRRTRRSFTADQKAVVVRRHLGGKVAVSDLADELGVQPSQIHLWVKHVLDQAAKAFEQTSGPTRAEAGKDRQIAQLRDKLVQKNEVISELMEENIRAKKSTGDL